MIQDFNSEELRRLIGADDTVAINDYIDKNPIDINQRFKLYNLTVWHEAAFKKDSKALKMLLEKYLKKDLLSRQTLNELDNNGLAPIHYAARAGCLENFRQLVKYDADPNLCTGEKARHPGQTAVEIFYIKYPHVGNFMRQEMRKIMDNPEPVRDELKRELEAEAKKNMNKISRKGSSGLSSYLKYLTWTPSPANGTATYTKLEDLRPKEEKEQEEHPLQLKKDQ